MKIGRFVATRAWQLRAFNNPPKGWAYNRCIDFPTHLFPISNQFLLNTKWPFNPKKFDLLHSYNAIIPTRIPWFVEVESELPRYGESASKWQVDFAVSHLQDASCKLISFTCEGAKKANREFLERHQLTSKTGIIYRPTPSLSFLPAQNQESPVLRLVFVGNAFFRKGGYASLLAVLALPENLKWTLTIISSFEIDWAVFPSVEQQKHVWHIISTDNRIFSKTGLSHDQTLEELKNSDLSLQPTHADSWNNVIPESMGQGTPVVATLVDNTREIVDSSCAYTIELEGTSMHKSIGHPRLVKAIMASILHFVDDKSKAQKIRQNGWQKVHSKFGLGERNKQLERYLT